MSWQWLSHSTRDNDIWENDQQLLATTSSPTCCLNKHGEGRQRGERGGQGDAIRISAHKVDLGPWVFSNPPIMSYTHICVALFFVKTHTYSILLYWVIQQRKGKEMFLLTHNHLVTCTAFPVLVEGPCLQTLISLYAVIMSLKYEWTIHVLSFGEAWRVDQVFSVPCKWFASAPERWPVNRATDTGTQGHGGGWENSQSWISQRLSLTATCWRRLQTWGQWWDIWSLKINILF